MNLKKRKNKKYISNFIILIFILVILSVIYILKIFNEKALPQFIAYSEIEINKIVTSIISNSVIDEIASNIVMEDLFITTKDNSDNIKSIDFNTSNVNKLLSLATKTVEKNLKYLEKGEIDKINLSNNLFSNYDSKKLNNGIIYELPSGIIFNNVILNNFFPKIPVKINLIGNIFCRLNTDINPYGINNALVKVNVTVEAEVKVLLPFVSTNTKISTDIPIIIKVIEGNVPSYYFSGYLENPMLTTSVQ